MKKNLNNQRVLLDLRRIRRKLSTKIKSNLEQQKITLNLYLRQIPSYSKVLKLPSDFRIRKAMLHKNQLKFSLKLHLS